MDPLSIAAIATAFLTAAATSAGQQVGSNVVGLIFEKFQQSGKQEMLQPFDKAHGAPSEGAKERVRDDLAVEIEKDPDFGVQVVEAANADLAENPGLADYIVHVVGRLWDLSPQQEIAQRNQCPVGGERLWRPPRYFNSDGSEIPGAAWNPLGFWGLPRSAIAKCRQSHWWPVFTIRSP